MLVKPMYPCQRNMPVVVFGNRCPNPCLYCDLCSRKFSEDEIIVIGKEKVLKKLEDYDKAYFSAVTDCLLKSNQDLTYGLLNGIWNVKVNFMPLIITKQVIPEKIIELLIKHKGKANIFISIPSLNDNLLSLLEPGAAKAAERIKNIERLTSNGVDVVAVIMPWFNFYEKGENIEDLPRELSRVGVRYCVLGTGVLPEVQRQKFLNTKNKAIIEMVNEIIGQKQVATKTGYILPVNKRVKLFKKMINALDKYGIKGRICVADNPDFDIKIGLPLCGKQNQPLCATLTSTI